MLAALGSPMLAQGGVVNTTLSPETDNEFQAYIKTREQGLEKLRTSGGFLWAARDAERLRQVKQESVLVEPFGETAVVPVTDGLIHDWVGSVFLPHATVNKTLALVQDYNNHKNIYQPEVIDSKLVNRKDDVFRIFLKLKKKKVLTVILNTDHEVHYHRLSPTRVWSKSFTTRISEVVDADHKSAHELPPGQGHGFLWRLNSYWRFEEKDGGTYLECEAISLSRGIPALLRRMITPIVRQLPEESLRNTLLATKAALAQRKSD